MVCIPNFGSHILRSPKYAVFPGKPQDPNIMLGDTPSILGYIQGLKIGIDKENNTVLI